jgi:hypothetical protein
VRVGGWLSPALGGGRPSIGGEVKMDFDNGLRISRFGDFDSG